MDEKVKAAMALELKVVAVGNQWMARKFGTFITIKTERIEIRETPDPTSRVVAIIESNHPMAATETKCACNFKVTMNDKTVEFNGPDSDLDMYQYILDNQTSTH